MMPLRASGGALLRSSWGYDLQIMVFWAPLLADSTEIAGIPLNERSARLVQLYLVMAHDFSPGCSSIIFRQRSRILFRLCAGF